MEATCVEEWFDIPNYEGYYQISNLGNVRSLDRIDSRGWKRKGNMRVLTHTQWGTTQVVLHKDGVGTTVTIKKVMEQIGVLGRNKPHLVG